MAIRAVVFDFDDCLIQTFSPSCEILAAAVNAWNQQAAHKLNMPEAHVLAGAYCGSFQNWIAGIWPEMKVFADDFEKVFLSMQDADHPMVPGAIEALEYVFSVGFVAGVFSGRGLSSLQKRMENAGLSKYEFAFVKSAEESGFGKPDHRSFGLLTKELAKKGIKPHETIYVGDQLADMGCEKVGMKFVAVCSGVIPAGKFIESGVSENDILGSIAELPQYIERNGSTKRDLSRR